jgi:hypothetical protein
VSVVGTALGWRWDSGILLSSKNCSLQYTVENGGRAVEKMLGIFTELFFLVVSTGNGG